MTSSRISHGSARSLLLTLLGEYVIGSDAPVWTSTLLTALGGVGVAEKSARQAIARAAQAGWIEGDRAGRRAAWRLADGGRQLIVEGSRRVRALRGGDAAPWSGRWLVLHITLPEAQRAERLRLYRALAWIGFGNPTPGLWVCPHIERSADARAVIDKFQLSDAAYAFVAEVLPFGIGHRDLVARAWNLDTIAEHYAELLRTFTALRPRAGSATLFAHIELVNALQRLPSIDPGLPDALLPKDWAARRAASKLIELRQKWADAAHAEWRDLASRAEG
jgi:phenylacetic acid degradation operon negative regulatory protein